MIRRVLICDDHAERVRDWEAIVHRRAPGAEVKTATGGELADLLRELSLAEQELRGTTSDDRPRDMIELAEWADVLIVDSDLTPAQDDLAKLEGHRRTEVAAILRNGYGDSVARQLRSYTSAKTIVVVNMFWGRHARSRVFDLTLGQAVNTFADLHITAGELDDGFLWGSGDAGRGDSFRPWQRPSIPQLVATFERSIAVKIDLDDNVMDHFKIDPAKLTATQLDPFTVAAPYLTFRDLVDSRLGFKYPTSMDGVTYPFSRIDAMSRSVARRWLERLVVPSQTVLLDVPHALERYWYLYENAPVEERPFDDLVFAEWGSDLGALGPALNTSVEPFVTRPVFDEEAARSIAVLSLAQRDRPPGSSSIAFAEDVSAMVDIDELTPFPSDVPGSFSRRWVREVEGIGYEPANRLLL